MSRLIPAHAGKTGPPRGGVGTRRAHPRSRGENADNMLIACLSVGSSPLTRGKPPPPSGARASGPAHPRSRGENCSGSSRASMSRGSSPLTRGKPAAAEARDQITGLIPAHAGKTRGRRGRSRGLAAHPRSRGENLDAPDRAVSTGGSSPLTRGKQVSASLDRAPRLAHPRSRGENIATTARSTDWPGSSPLTRGKPASCMGVSTIVRLIPAHAGKTHLRLRAGRHTPAHPRSRGENGPPPQHHHREKGSSPLTRGKRAPYGQTLPVIRLIPAHAGKTAAR